MKKYFTLIELLVVIAI
ncbi:MAG TPA: hypothetical protein DFL85_13680, partial [Lentisphaeria bacterium]|nr:hypothetical protein [Lentisphaeria bacterium]